MMLITIKTIFKLRPWVLLLTGMVGGRDPSGLVVSPSGGVVIGAREGRVDPI